MPRTLELEMCATGPDVESLPLEPGISGDPQKHSWKRLQACLIRILAEKSLRPATGVMVTGVLRCNSLSMGIYYYEIWYSGQAWYCVQVCNPSTWEAEVAKITMSLRPA